MKCIYCKKPTTGNEGEAHIFPEALTQNNLVLPKGTVCDCCNNYCSKLDSVLILHNHIAPLIQILGIKGGKKGKERQKIGYFKRSGNNVSINVTDKEISLTRRDGSLITVHVKNPPGFDDLKFRRALYSIAFNFVAQHLSNEELLLPLFDDVRNYIRAPKPKEKWSYCQMMREKGEINLEAVPCYSFYPESLLIRLRIFRSEFYVDLLSPGDLHERLKRVIGKEIGCR
jgi:hypothetical protein